MKHRHLDYTQRNHRDSGFGGDILWLLTETLAFGGHRLEGNNTVRFLLFGSSRPTYNATCMASVMWALRMMHYFLHENVLYFGSPKNEDHYLTKACQVVFGLYQ